MTTLRRHNCARQHRSFRAFARCVWPRAAFLGGNGPCAVVSHCRRRHPTISLHATEPAATARLDWLDGCGCGGHCSGRHELVRLVLEPAPAAPAARAVDERILAERAGRRLWLPYRDD